MVSPDKGEAFVEGEDILGGSNGSSDYLIAFSTTPELHIRPGYANKVRTAPVLGNEGMSPLNDGEEERNKLSNALFLHDFSYSTFWLLT